MMIQRIARSAAGIPAALVVLGLTAGGCYTHVPTNLADPPLEVPVRAHLSDPALERLAGIPRAGTRYLDGSILRRQGETYLFDVLIRSVEGVTPDRNLSQRIELGRSEIVRVEVRQFDRRRTVLFALGLAVVGGYLAQELLSGEAGGGAFPPADDGQTESVTPRFPLIGPPPAAASRPRGGGDSETLVSPARR